jgi:hypothetical protein
MISLALNASNDLELDELTGTIKMVSDGDEVCQQVRTRLLFYLGEWFLDTTVGIPYFQEVFTKPAIISLVESRLKDEIISTPGVLSLDSFATNFNSTTRALTVSFSATTIYGSVSSSLFLNKV